MVGVDENCYEPISKLTGRARWSRLGDDVGVKRRAIGSDSRPFAGRLTGCSSWRSEAGRRLGGDARKSDESRGDGQPSRLLLAVSTDTANHHEVKLVQLCFDFYMVEAAKPENLIANWTYHSGELDDELREEGVEMVAPHRKS